MLAQGEPGIYTLGRPNVLLPVPQQYVPNWAEGQVPYSYIGPVAPVSWSEQRNGWLYPDWC